MSTGQELLEDFTSLLKRLQDRRMVNAAVEHAFLKLDESYGFIRQLTRSDLELLFTDPVEDIGEELESEQARVNEDLDNPSRHQDPLPPAAIPDQGPVANIGDPPKLPPAVPFTETEAGRLDQPIGDAVEPVEGNSVNKETAPIIIEQPIQPESTELDPDKTDEELREEEEAKVT